MVKAFSGEACSASGLACCAPLSRLAAAGHLASWRTVQAGAKPISVSAIRQQASQRREQQRKQAAGGSAAPLVPQPIIHIAFGESRPRPAVVATPVATGALMMAGALERREAAPPQVQVAVAVRATAHTLTAQQIREAAAEAVAAAPRIGQRAIAILKCYVVRTSG